MSLHSLQSECNLQRFTFYVRGSDSVQFTKAIKSNRFPSKYSSLNLNCWQHVINTSMTKSKARELYRQLKDNGAYPVSEHNNHNSHSSP